MGRHRAHGLRALFLDEGHRHGPELETVLEPVAGRPVVVDMNTTHGNFTRGMTADARIAIVWRTVIDGKSRASWNERPSPMTSGVRAGKTWRSNRRPSSSSSLLSLLSRN